MALDPVPWMVGGGALHSAEVARLVAYAAFNGNEGIVSPTSLRVADRTVPTSQVGVNPGAATILCRASAQTYQAYAARMPTTTFVDVAATGGTLRRDMVILRVEDPTLAGEPWSVPASVQNGPYVFARVLSNVPASAIASKDAARDYLAAQGFSAIALAGLTIPANTGAITQSMITDLRIVANPRRETVANHMNSTSGDALNAGVNVWEEFPDGVHFDYLIPTWAVRCFITGFVEGVKQSKAGVGGLRVAIYSGSTLVGATQTTNVNEDKYVTGAFDRRSYNVGGEIAIPETYRGTTCRLRVEGTYTSGASQSFLVTDQYSTGQIQAIFEERAA